MRISHGVTANSLYLNPFHHANLHILLHVWCHHKQSLLKSFHHGKLQVLLHGVTANSLKLLIIFTMQSYKTYLHGVTANSLYLNPFHHAKLQILFMFYIFKSFPEQLSFLKFDIITIPVFSTMTTLQTE